MGNTKDLGVELNSAGRRRFTTLTLATLARELRLHHLPAVSLRGDVFPPFQNDTSIKEALFIAARGMLHTHLALLYGGTIGWDEYAEGRNWPRFDVSAPFSPYTWVQDSFEFAQNVPGQLDRWSAHEELYFTPNCFTELPLSSNAVVLNHPRLEELVGNFAEDKCIFYLSSNAVVLNHHRLEELVGNFAEDKCIFYHQGDGQVSAGLHPLAVSMVDSYVHLAGMDSQDITEDTPAYKFVMRYEFGSPEWGLGLGKSIVLTLEEALTLLATNMGIMAAVFSIVTCVILAQAIILGGRLQKLMQENLSMKLIIERFLQAADDELLTLEKQEKVKHFNEDYDQWDEPGYRGDDSRGFRLDSRALRQQAAMEVRSKSRRRWEEPDYGTDPRRENGSSWLEAARQKARALL